MKRALADAGRVLAAWWVGLALEHLAVGLGWRDELTGAWEVWRARSAGAPLFVGLSVVAACGVVAAARLDAMRDRRPIEAGAAVAGAAVGWGVGTGRHFAFVGYRVVLALAVAGVAILTVKALARFRGRRAWVLGALALLAWWVDGHVLVRLYPAFHAGLFALSLVALGLASIEACVLRDHVAIGVLVVSLGCLGYVPVAARRLQSYENLRRVLVEHAPWMGRAVRVGAWIAPPEAAFAPSTLTAPGEVARALDWTGLDLVLLSIDALRADHLGAYGYARPTTPRIDALAREGTLFEHAYCPTPHTSYSVTSMMTGKYMRPLLTLGLGQDSDTLASDLRRYGYRTAGFYPPAVFFIDQPKFASFEARGLDFEYRKVEFADPVLREMQVRDYLVGVPKDKSLFLWVHFFEPHEPYVAHADHRFGDRDIDLYDGEVATADDGVGRVVDLVRKTRPGAVVIVTADHGEEFGDHGGRYHGTTVYEEQVRVPLVVLGRGVQVGGRVVAPVQTIDVVPTVLSALGIPRPPRVRGRDLGEWLVGRASRESLAFAETDGASLLARGALRLVCDKQADACAVFDIASDPAERHDVRATHEPEGRSMRGELVALERSHGRFEGEGASLPDALRRGAAGDVAAAQDVATLLDDVNVTYRREAARELFDLKTPKVTAQLGRAAHDEDDLVRGLAVVAQARVDASVPAPALQALLTSAPEEVSRRAALVLAERGDPAGVPTLLGWLPQAEFTRQREILAGIEPLKAHAALGPLVALLDDVRLRGLAAKTLGSLGDPAARGPLLLHFEAEPYVPMREPEARALLALGARNEMGPALLRYAGAPEPMPGALEIAAELGLLIPKVADVSAPVGPLRLGVLLVRPAADLSVEIDGVPATPFAARETERWADIPTHGNTVTVRATAAGGIRGFWLVPRAGSPGTF